MASEIHHLFSPPSPYSFSCNIGVPPLNNEEVVPRTPISITGFPDDIQMRELWNLVVDLSGFRVTQLGHKVDGDRIIPEGRVQFETPEQAVAARDILDGKFFDPLNLSFLQTELVEENLIHVGVESLPPPAVQLWGSLGPYEDAAPPYRPPAAAPSPYHPRAAAPSPYHPRAAAPDPYHPPAAAPDPHYPPIPPPPSHDLMEASSSREVRLNRYREKRAKRHGRCFDFKVIWPGRKEQAQKRRRVKGRFAPEKDDLAQV